MTFSGPKVTYEDHIQWAWGDLYWPYIPPLTMPLTNTYLTWPIISLILVLEVKRLLVVGWVVVATKFNVSSRERISIIYYLSIYYTFSWPTLAYPFPYPFPELPNSSFKYREFVNSSLDCVPVSWNLKIFFLSSTTQLWLVTLSRVLFSPHQSWTFLQLIE